MFVIIAEVISYGQTEFDYQTKDPEVLSYLGYSEVAVLAKGVHYNGEEMWLAKVSYFRVKSFHTLWEKNAKNVNK